MESSVTITNNKVGKITLRSMRPGDVYRTGDFFIPNIATNRWTKCHDRKYQYQLRPTPFYNKVNEQLVTRPETIVNEYLGVSEDILTGTTVIFIDALSDEDNFKIGDLIMIHQTQSSRNQETLGKYEFNVVKHIFNTRIIVENKIKNDYYSDEIGDKINNTKTQIVKVACFGDLIISKKGNITAKPWNGNFGGITAIKADNIYHEGAIDANGKGFRGGETSSHGESFIGLKANYGLGAGNGSSTGNFGSIGAPGGHRTVGSKHGKPGNTYGFNGLNTKITMGAGGASNTTNQNGGAGGGIVYIECSNSFECNVEAKGEIGHHEQSGKENFHGGAGAGGSVYVKGKEFKDNYNVDGASFGSTGGIGYFLQDI